MIAFEQVCKTYDLNKRQFDALKNINLTIKKGEIFGIFGESGAGKSTLLRSINLLERPTSGKIIVNGIDLTVLSNHELRKERRHIGMIFQHFNLLQSRTAFENIALPLELIATSARDIETEVNSLLSLIHLENHKDHYPSQLSGGQKQRVAIARALATKPKILLCDEPTSALDPHSAQSVLNLLKEINHKLGVTIVIITHELKVIKQICHRAAILNDGQLVEEGTLVELFARPKSLLTKQFAQKALHSEIPEIIKKNLQAEADPKKSRIVRFTFVGEDSTQPLITTLVKKFDITINIIQANIENIQDVTIGFTLCQLTGDHQAIDQALTYIQPSQVTAEVLGYV